VKALVWKEVRELAPGFALFLGSCIALGVVDVAYNWRHERFVGISLIFCWLVSVVAALRGGANAFAREQRGQLSFLATWPVSRGQMWTAKVIVPVVKWIVLFGAAFGTCSGLLAMRGYAVGEVVRQLSPPDLWIIVAVWIGLFTLGLLASTAIPSAIGAAVAAVPLGALLIALYVYLYQDFIPGHLGPKLGLVLPDFQNAAHLMSVIVVGVICIISSALAFLRARMLETLKRTLAVIGSFIGLIAVAVGLSLGIAWFALRPSPPAEYHAGVDRTGQWITLHGKGGLPERGAIWAMDVEGERLHLIARGPVGWYGFSPATAQAVLDWGKDNQYHWLADLATGRLRRLPGRARNEGEEWGWWSPRGTYLALERGRLVKVSGRRIERVDIGEWPESEKTASVSRCFVGWAADESEMYVALTPSIVPVEGAEQIHTRLVAVSVPGGKKRLVGELEGGWSFWSLSPDGRWLAGYRTDIGSSQPPKARETMLVDLRSGGLHKLSGVNPSLYGWSPDARFVWCYGYRDREDHSTRYVAALEVPSLKVIAEVHREDLDGWVPMMPWVSPGGKKVLIGAYRPKPEAYQRASWIGDVDGSNLRKLDIKGKRAVGWTHDDNLIVQTEDNGLMRVDVETGDERVIYDRPLDQPTTATPPT